MASTTKIMTCILAAGKMQGRNRGPCLSEPGCIDAGGKASHKKKCRMEDLLYSLMLESHNDSAVAIARQLGQCGKVCGHDEREGSGTWL